MGASVFTTGAVDTWPSAAALAVGTMNAPHGQADLVETIGDALAKIENLLGGAHAKGRTVISSPVLDADNAAPNLGATSFAYADYEVSGGRCQMSAHFQFGGSGQSGGNGQFKLAVPVPANMAQVGAAPMMSSRKGGTGLLVRNYGGLLQDLTGAHYNLWAYFEAASGGNYVKFVASDAQSPRDAAVHAHGGALSNQAAAGVNVGSVSFTQKNPWTRWRVSATVGVAIDVTAPRSVYATIVPDFGSFFPSGAVNIGAVNVVDLTQLSTIVVDTGVFVPSVFDIVNLSLTSNVATFTTLRNHNFAAGNLVHVEAATPSFYNGDFTVASAPTSKTFTVALTHANDTTGAVGGPWCQNNTHVPSGTHTYTLRVFADGSDTIDITEWQMQATPEAGLGPLGAPMFDYVDHRTPFPMGTMAAGTEFMIELDYPIALP